MIVLIILLQLINSCTCDTVYCDDQEAIQSERWCDGRRDCSDGSDEKSGCCPYGLTRDKTNACIDVDECQMQMPRACSQICRNNNGGYECSCMQGYNLVNNVCRATGDNLKLLVSFSNGIWYTKDLKKFSKLPLPLSSPIYDFDLDYKSGTIFWCAGEDGGKSIWKADINSKDLEMSGATKIRDDSDCISVAVEWISKKLYWMEGNESNNARVMVSNYDGNAATTLIWKSLQAPKTLVVDPSTGYMFWTNWQPDPQIGRAQLNGENKKVLLSGKSGDDIARPTALTVDYTTSTLYWIDGVYHRIYMSDFNGVYTVLTQRETIIPNSLRMTVFEDTVYWTETTNVTIIKTINKRTGYKTTAASLRSVVNIGGIRVYHKLAQPASQNTCDRRKCEYQCLLTPDGSSCACQDGVKLRGDRTTCEDIANPCSMGDCDNTQCMRCGDGTCILQSFRCDNYPDCEDGTDELQCAPTTPLSSVQCESVTEFACANGRQCIRRSQYCNGKPDCNDKSDEEPIASCKGRNSCAREEFACDNGRLCLPQSSVCDGITNCVDKSDESSRRCGGSPCDSTEFTCTNTRTCIPLERRCDGHYDCRDKSDERDCKIVCNEYEAQCRTDGKCIDKKNLCDGIWDCSDGSDENYCPETKLCKIGEDACPNKKRCIKKAAFCNGVDDCGDESDERNCCTDSSQTQCRKTGTCIPREKWCDGVRDCPEGDDELPGCCPVGYIRESSQAPCVDEDECAGHEGKCSQHCNNTDGSFDCWCDEGYDLDVKPQNNRLFNTTKKTYCKAKGNPMYMIISLSKREPMFLKDPDSKTGDFTAIDVHGEFNVQKSTIFDFDFDIRKGRIFFCATEQQLTTPYRRTLWAGWLVNDLSQIYNTKVIVENIECEAIAVDWINGLVYWTSTTNTIEVIDYEGINRRAIIWDGLQKPRAIDIDPEAGYIFWSDWGAEAHIGRANMDGTNRTVLVSNKPGIDPEIVWPNTLTIDLPNKNVYWMDSHIKFVECMNYTAAARYTISSSSNSLGHAWRLRVFQDRIYWTDMEHPSKTISVNKFNGGDYKEHIAPKHAGTVNLRLYHETIQPMSPSRCAKKNCQHLCLPKPIEEGGAQCACHTGHELMYDFRSCKAKMDTYAFVAMDSMIVRMALEPLEPAPQPILFREDTYVENKFASLAFYDGWLYYNVISTKHTPQVTINRMRYDGSTPEVIVAKKSVGGLSIDWINTKLYWANADTVSVGELDGSIHTTIFQKLGYDFRDILVDPYNGFIYLSAWGVGIFRMSMDGDKESFTQLLFFEGLEKYKIQPTGLTLDCDTKKLFFANRGTNTLYRSQLYPDPNQKLVLEPLITRENTIISTDILGQKIVWTEWMGSSFGSVMEMGKLNQYSKNGKNYNGYPLRAIRDNLTDNPSGIKIYPTAKCEDNQNDSCKDNKCSHMCLQRRETNGTKTFKCVCPTGYALKANSKTDCADAIDKYLVFNPKNGIQAVSLDTDFLTAIKETSNMNSQVKAFDINSLNNRVYYVYGYPNTFQMRKLFDSEFEPMNLDIHTLNVSGLAVEWVTNKLYIADKGEAQSDKSGVILVIDINRPSLIRHIVTNIGPEELMDIAVHPKRSRIYWILSNHNIMSTNMDGSAPMQTLVSSKENILEDSTTRLFIDYDNDLLYWTENVFKKSVGNVGYIKRVSLKGSRAADRKVEVVLERIQLNLSGVTILGNALYYTDNKGNLYKLQDDKNTLLIPMGDNPLIIRSSTSQAKIDNPCEDNNGGCSDFCILDSITGYRCTCPTGIELIDALNCATPFNRTLVVANSTRINMISLVNSDKVIDRVLTSKPVNLRCIDVDIRKNKIYWGEVHDHGSHGRIWELDVRSGETELIVSGDNIKIPNSIAVDWNAGNLYWVDFGDRGKGTLEVMSLRSRLRATLQKKPGDQQAHLVVVDPLEEYIFVSYPLTSNTVITRMWLDGSNPFEIKIDDSLKTTKVNQIIKQLAIDIQYKKLYWASTDNLHHIIMCDYDGRSKAIINSIPIESIQSLSILNHNIFIQNTSEAQTKIEVYASSDTTDRSVHTYTLLHITGILVSMKASSILPIKDVKPSCNDDRICPGMICIPTPIEVQCLCADNDTDCADRNDRQVDAIQNVLPEMGEPCPKNYCGKGGTCYQTHDTQYHCNCNDGYSGKKCTERVNNNHTTLILVTVGIIFAFVVVGFVCYRHSQNKIPCIKPSEPDPSEESLPVNDDTYHSTEPQVAHLSNLTKKFSGTYTQRKIHYSPANSEV